MHTCSSPERVTRLVANAESWARRGRATSSRGAAHQEAEPPPARVSQQHRSGTSQIPVLRTAHRSSFTERQMLHPSQISPGYNAHLEIPR